MYELNVANALVPAQTDMQVREVTIGALLREVATEKPHAEALVEITQANELRYVLEHSGAASMISL